MSADPFTVHRGLGAQLQTYSLVEFGNVVHGFGDDEVQADVARVKSLGIPHKDTTDEDLPMASRLYLAMRQFIEAERLDALSVRCWPEMPNTFGQWPYLGMARLADEGLAIACEGDADGALSAWVGESLGLGRCYLSDWLEHDARHHHPLAWRCRAALAFAAAGPARRTAHRPAFQHQEAGRSGSDAPQRHAGHRHAALALRRRYLLTAREGQTVHPGAT